MATPIWASVDSRPPTSRTVDCCTPWPQTLDFLRVFKLFTDCDCRKDFETWHFAFVSLQPHFDKLFGAFQYFHLSPLLILRSFFHYLLVICVNSSQVGLTISSQVVKTSIQKTVELLLQVGIRTIPGRPSLVLCRHCFSKVVQLCN